MTAISATRTESMTLRAPAKINLGLRLLGVREDGYHTLESVFAPIEIWDELELEISPGELRIDLEIEPSPGEELPAALSAVTAGPDNLVVRAALAFARETGLKAGIRLRLRKQIPAGAGLGGGSSDAAAVLLGLASVFDGELADEALHALGLSLGADVPFFLNPAPALVCGIGEKIESLAGLPAFDLVVVNPGISLATAEVYRAADALRSALTESEPGSTMRAISRLRGETGDMARALGDLLINDLEPAARRLCPPVARLVGRLRETGAIGVSMSGSGATVFGVFESGGRASRAAEMLRASESSESWIRVTRIITSG
jgi:4-diphosphocytidyl-2-C-methyl-D-erythritol kinase